MISASQKKKVVQGRTAGSRNQTRNGQPGKESGGLRQWYRGRYETRPCSNDQLAFVLHFPTIVSRCKRDSGETGSRLQ